MTSRDSSRWKQMPGAEFYARYNWRAILPIPRDSWNHCIPVFGLHPDYLSGKTASTGPEPAVSSSQITHPDPPTHHALSPAGAFPAGLPMSHGTLGHPDTFPSSATASYDTFQPPGVFHGGLSAGHGTFGPQGTFPASTLTGFNTFQYPTTSQPSGTFHSGFPNSHVALGPQGIFAASGSIGYSTFQPPTAFAASGPTGNDTFKPPGVFPTGTPTNHHPLEPTGSLPTHAPAGNHAPEPTKKVDSCIAPGEREIERASHVAIPVSTDHSPSEAGPEPPGLFPASGFSYSGTRAIKKGDMVKCSLADPKRADFSGFKTTTSEATGDITHQALHRENKDPATQPTSAPFLLGKPTTKRGRSPPSMVNVEEEGSCRRVLETTAHKKQKVGAQQQPSDWQDLSFQHAAATQSLRNPTLERPRSIPMATKHGTITNLSAPTAASSGQRGSIDDHPKSKEKRRTQTSSSKEEAQEVPAPKSAIRHLGIEERVHRERVWALSQSAHLRDSPSRSERDSYLQECIEVQRQSLRLFYRSAAGQKTVEYNTDFTGFHHGGSGMKCSLCQTTYHDQYGSKQNPTASEFKIVAGASTFLRDVLHRHTSYEPSVRCEEVLSMMARYPAFRKIPVIPTERGYG